MTKHFLRAIIFLSIFIIVLVAGYSLGMGKFLPGSSPQNPPPIDQKDNRGIQACTAEAKICPDGSSVGRVGPNCEFELCPSSPASPSAQTMKSFSDTHISFQYPDTWQLTDMIPEAYQFKNSTESKMFNTTCRGPILVNDTLHSVMAFEIFNPKSGGGFCWSEGILSETRNTQVVGTNWKKNTSKWVSRAVGSTWQGDYISVGVNDSLKNKKEFIVVPGLYTTAVSKKQADRDFEAVVTSIQVK